MSKTRMWTLLVLVFGLIGAFVATGCGDDDSDSDGGSETSTEAEAPESPSGIASVADLDGKIVGAQDGTTGETYAQEETGASEVRGFPEGNDAIAAVRTGQVDALIIDQPVAVDAIEKRDGLEIVEEIPTDELYGFAMSPETPNLRAAVNDSLAGLKEDGTLAEIFQKYFKSDPPAAVLDGINELAEPAGDAGGELELIEDGVLLVGTDAPYEPFEIGTPPDITGFDIEIMDAIAADLELETEYVDTSFDTIFRDVANNQFDIVAAASTITPKRENAVDFSDPYYEAQQALVVATE